MMVLQVLQNLLFVVLLAVVVSSVSLVSYMKRLVVSSRFSLRMLSVILLLTLNMLNGELEVALVTLYSFLRSKTVTALDVVYALKRSGRTLYGFGA